ncbi:histidine kinase [Paenibacillus doosanensis]|uniref:Sensor histidine kinase YehU n=1 Tax=Paenibacillus konkukensis TaxID=2020716 RepID=A0ABY4RTY3_9BACL|nr:MULTISPECIES: sensor histidine kinase [Paenibacillus]MCS7460969.1 histidine kinase [Paenibacillus doosanensis]UQZ85638.1 Sensor histidine kinase YehU [Paenibacillus konkukensis]
MKRGERWIKRLSLNSIRTKLVLGVLLIIVPLNALMLGLSFYSIKVVHNQVADSNNNMLSLYMEQFDEKLRRVDEYLLGLMQYESNLSILQSPASEWNHYSAIHNLSNNVTANIVSYDFLAGIFVYSAPGDDYIYAFNRQTQIGESDYIRSYVRDAVRSDRTPREWFERGWFIVHPPSGASYFVRLMRSENGYVGAWMNIANVQLPLPLVNIGDQGAALFVDEQGAPLTNASFVGERQVQVDVGLTDYYMTGQKERFLALGKHSTKGAFSLFVFLPEDKILEKLPDLQKVVVTITVSSFAILPVSLLLLRKSMLIPIRRLLRAIKQIMEGNLDVRIAAFRTSEEFRIVNDSFNHMISQIQELRIRVYEEKLDKQKAELQHLQLQLNPHTFINSLNMLHMLARTGEYRTLEDISLCLIHYYRYNFRSNLTLVTLKEELQHVRNYIRIQEQRFPDNIRMSVQVPDFLLREPVPPLIIQTFVENTVKHAVTLDEPIDITVHAEVAVCGEQPYLLLRVQDTGMGFPDQVLSDLAGGNRIYNEEGERIGIWNVKRRLHIIYENKADIRFANGEPHGAKVELRLPIYHEPEKRKLHESAYC